MTPAVTLAEEFARSHGKRVEELMSNHVITANEDASLNEIASLLEKHHIKRVLILKNKTRRSREPIEPSSSTRLRQV